jgi:ATP-dependent helicase/nuclease subunit B
MAAVADGQTILAPNTELAAALFDAVERTYLDSGLDVWPTPRVRDFGGWLREQHAARQLEDAASPRTLSEIEERELWRAVIDSSEVGRDMLEPAGAVRAARRARRAIYEHGIPLQAVAAYASGSEESRVFLDWNREFDARCRLSDCIGADEMLGLAPAPAQPIAWIESPAWRPMARRWLERHGRMLAAVACGARLSRVSAVSPAAELAAIADWALVNWRSAKHFRAWVCIPDLNRRRAEVVDAFDAALAPQRFALTENPHSAPYAVAGGTPLAEFAPVRAALDLLAASIDSVSFQSFSALLRAQELQATAADAGAAALLDVQLRRRGPDEADAASWLAAAERIAAAQGLRPVAALQRLAGAFRALEQLRGNQPISRWVGAWIAAFEAGPWALRHRWSSAEYQAAERFRELLAALAAADAFFGTHSRRSAQRILRRAARDTLFQVQTGVPPIWISAQLIDPWLNYEGLWVSGCDDERWPPAVEPIALLPVKLQREFGVISAGAQSQLQFALELQNRWIARAGECVFSYANPGDGRSAAPSPVLPETAQRPASSATPHPHWHALLRAQPTLERLTDETAPAFGADERTRGVSTLRAQSRCAFRGFADTRLGCEPLERPLPGFNRQERGNLIHHALEHIWSVLRDSNALLSISVEERSRLVNDAASRAITKICRIRDPGPRWRQRERERMNGVLGRWLDVERQREPFEVEQLEQGSDVAHHAGLDFRVRIDRVDRLADGTRVLIDYKTGAATADWRGDRPDNPQLPIYALLRPAALVAVAYGHVNAAKCSFIAETDRAAVFKPRGQKSTLEGMASLAALIPLWSARIESLAADFAAGRAAVAPTLKACRTCSLHGLCRVPAALEEEDS